MLEILKEKMLSWTRQGASEFFGNISRYNPMGDKTWEITPTGYFLVRADKAEYRDYNGKRYCLCVGDESKNLQLKQQIAEAVAGKDQAQIETVTHFETLEIFAIDCTYSEHQNPVPGRGLPVLNTMLVDPENMPTVGVESSKVLLREAEKLIISLDEILTESTDYPEIIASDLLFYYPENDSWFWSGDFTFNSERSNAIRMLARTLVGDLEDTLSKGFGIPCDGITAQLQNFINTECSILPNLQ